MDNLGNPWKLGAIAMALVVVTAVTTTLAVTSWSSRQPARVTPGDADGSASPAAAAVVAPAAAPAPAPATVRPSAAVPSTATVETCNRYAASQPTTKDKTIEIVKDGAIGAAIGAAVGAAGGAIAGGGKGAGTGAAVGGVVGVTGGALYGLNENKKNDERYRAAYASCLRSRGYAG
jgi:hypothetical protein